MKKVLFSLLIIIALVLLPLPAQAADFSVVPSKVELKAEAGQAVENTITVANTGKDDLSVFTEVQDYTITENNEFVYYPAGELKYSAAQWVSLDKKQFDLKPDEKQQIKISFSVPAGVDPRGYQSILFVSASSKKTGASEGTTLNIIGRIGIVLLGEVNSPSTGGKTSLLKREGEIKDFKLTASFPSFISIKNGNLSLNFNGLFKPDVKAVAQFKNTGITHLTLGGTTSFSSNYFGGKQIVDLQSITTLPDSVRNIEANWQNPVFFGPISANVNLTWEGGPNLEKSVSLWVIPWNLIWVLAIILALVILIIIITFRRHRRHQKLQAMMEELLRHEEEDKSKKKGRSKKEEKKEEPVFQEVREELAEVKEKKHPGWRTFGWILLFAAVVASAAVIGFALARLFSEGGFFKETATPTASLTPTEEIQTVVETSAVTVAPTETASTEAIESPTTTTTLLSSENYTVQSGDTLLGIAQKFGISDWHDLATLNNITDPTSLHPGDILKIPKK